MLRKTSPRFYKFILKPCMHWFCFISVCFGCFASSVPVYEDLIDSLTLYVLRRMALDGIRMPDGCYADGTWELKMHVTDLNRDVSLRVTGEIHVGGVMLKLVEKLGMHRKLIVNAFQRARNRCLTQLYSLTHVHFPFFWFPPTAPPLQSFPPTKLFCTFLRLRFHAPQRWLQLSTRVLCSKLLNAAHFDGSWRRFNSGDVWIDSALCVDGAQMLGIPAALQGFIPCLWTCF